MSYNAGGLLRINGDGWIGVSKTVAFDGTAGNGAVGTVALFTVTGKVLGRYFIPYVTENLAEAGATATIDVGTATDTNFFRISPTGGATVLVADDYWAETAALGGLPKVSNVPTSASAGQSGASGFTESFYVAENIIATVGSQNITDGTIVFTMEWRPLPGTSGLVVAA